MIILDPGHGGHDPGTVANGLRECDINLSVALKLAAVISQRGLCCLTRLTDIFVPLPERVEIAHYCAADLFVSIHCNAPLSGNAEGFEIWTSVGDTPADPVAESIFEAMMLEFPQMIARSDWADGDPDKEAGFYVLRKTRMPAVLVELGFLTNEADAALLRDHQDRFVAALAAGLGGYV